MTFSLFDLNSISILTLWGKLFYLNDYLELSLLQFNTLFNIEQYNSGYFLGLILLVPLLFSFFIFFIPNSNFILIRKVGLFGSAITFFLSIILWIIFDNFTFGFQYTLYLNWFDIFNFNYVLGVDGISILFIILTTLLIPLCILISWNSIKYCIKEYIICLLITEFFLLNIFLALDLVLFYIYFESILIPMFFLIGIWGARTRKIHAAYQFFLYTLLGSVLMLLAILIIYFQIGTTDIQIFLNSNFSENKQILLWLFFFIPFAVKVPMIPTHIWLPEAHVEAPTAGSVLLAGVLLKLGTYGVLRFLIPVFSYANYFFTPLVLTISLIGILYGSCTTIRQIDLKKIIAYSSVAHMNFAMLGLFTPNLQGLGGSIFLLLSHGIVSGALFLCVGILYDRYHTRILKYYGGLASYMPVFTGFFLVFTLANIGFPGTSNFVGEFMIILGTFQFNTFVIILGTLSVVLGACYALWLFNRVMYGPLKINFIFKFCDVNKRETYILFPLLFIVLYSGVYPNLFFDVFNFSLLNLKYFNIYLL